MQNLKNEIPFFESESFRKIAINSVREGKTDTGRPKGNNFYKKRKANFENELFTPCSNRTRFNEEDHLLNLRLRSLVRQGLIEVFGEIRNAPGFAK